VYFLWKREKRRKEKKRNDHHRQTTHHLSPRATSTEREHDDTFKDMIEWQVWPPYDIIHAVQKARTTLTRWRVKSMCQQLFQIKKYFSNLNILECLSWAWKFKNAWKDKNALECMSCSFVFSKGKNVFLLYLKKWKAKKAFCQHL